MVCWWLARSNHQNFQVILPFIGKMLEWWFMRQTVGFPFQCPCLFWNLNALPFTNQPAHFHKVSKARCEQSKHLGSSFPNPYHPWDWYIYLHEWWIFMAKCREIYHTWTVWAMLQSLLTVTLQWVWSNTRYKQEHVGARVEIWWLMSSIYSAARLPQPNNNQTLT